MLNNVGRKNVVRRLACLLLIVAVASTACSREGGGDELDTVVEPPPLRLIHVDESPTPTTTFTDPVVGPGGPQERGDADGGVPAPQTPAESSAAPAGPVVDLPDGAVFDLEKIGDLLAAQPDGASLLPDRPTTTTTVFPDTRPVLPARVGEPYMLVTNYDDRILDRSGTEGYYPSHPVELQIGSWQPLPEHPSFPGPAYRVIVEFRHAEKLSASNNQNVYFMIYCAVAPDLEAKALKYRGVQANGYLYQRYAVLDDDGRWRVEAASPRNEAIAPGRGGSKLC